MKNMKARGSCGLPILLCAGLCLLQWFNCAADGPISFCDEYYSKKWTAYFNSAEIIKAWNKSITAKQNKYWKSYWFLHYRKQKKNRRNNIALLDSGKWRK